MGPREWGEQCERPVGSPGRQDVTWVAKQSHLIFEREQGWPGDVGASSKEGRYSPQCPLPIHNPWGLYHLCAHQLLARSPWLFIRCGSQVAPACFARKNTRVGSTWEHTPIEAMGTGAGMCTQSGLYPGGTTLRLTHTTSRANLGT